MKKTVVFDFDGVIHSYKSGFKGADVIPDPPVDGMKEVIEELCAYGYNVVVCTTRALSTRGAVAVREWLEAHEIFVDDVTAEKVPAICYIDDRGICFEGHTVGLVDRIKNFKSWTEA